MGLIDSLREAFSTKARGDSSVSKITPTGYEAAGFNTALTSSMKNSEYLNEMKGWVGAAVTAIADEVASMDIKLYKMEGDGVDEVTEHELLDVLFKVNNFTTKFDHFWLTQSFLELTGEAPWFLEREGGKVVNIYFLRPDKIKPVTGDSKMIEGYEYEIQLGEKVLLTTDEVIFLKYPNPAKPFRGIGTLEMAALTVDIDKNAEEWNKTFYQNSARPDSILSVKTDQMNDEQKDRLKKSLEKAYQGNANAHKTMVLFGEMEFQKSGFSQKDMDYLEQQKFGRDKILGIFRVPKAIVAQTDDVNFASSKTAEYIFARYTIRPKMERLVQQLNEFLLPMFENTDNMFLDFDSPVPADKEGDIARYNSALENGWMTINEIREEQGLPPIEGGDILQIPQGKKPIGTEDEDMTGQDGGEGDKPPKEDKPPKDEEKPKPEEDREEEDQKKAVIRKHGHNRYVATRVRGKSFFEVEQIKKKTKKEVKEALWSQYKIEKNIKIKKRQEEAKKKEFYKNQDRSNGNEIIQRVMTEKEINEYWVAKNKIYQEFLPDIKKGMENVFKVQRKVTLIKMSQKQNSDDLFNDVKLDVDREEERTLSIVGPALEDLFIAAGDETYQQMQVEAEVEAGERVRSIIRDNGREFARNVAKTTNKYIKEEIIAGLGKGESIPELKKRIIGVFDKAESYRAERIARTETLRYNTLASEQAFIDSGIVEGKMWVTDPEPCPYCAPLAGKTAGLGEVMIAKGDMLTPSGGGRPRTNDYDDLPAPPLHPNCQCDIVPVYKPVKANASNLDKGLSKTYSIASSAKKELDRSARNIAHTGIGRRVAAAPLKNRETAYNKILRDYDGDWNKISDIARNTIVVNSQSEYLLAIKELKQEYEKKIIGGKVIKPGDDPSGYTGGNFKYMTSNKLVGEIQVNTSWMIYAKEKPEDARAILGDLLFNKIKEKVKLQGGRGHEIYEKTRDMVDSPEKTKLIKESKKYYDTIRKRVGDSI